MAHLHYKRRWASKPTCDHRIDWANPLAEGLVAFYIAGDNPGAMVDLVNRRQTDLTTGKTTDISELGRVLDFDSTAHLGIRPAGVYDIGYRGFTVFGKMRRSNTSTDDALMGMSDGASPGLQFWADNFGSGDRFGFAVNNSVSTYQIAYGSTHGDTEWHNIACVSDATVSSSGTHTLFVDGVNEGTASGDLKASFSAAEFVIGDVGSIGGKQLYGQIEHVLIFDKPKSEAEIARLSENPWQLLQPRKYHMASAGGTEVTGITDALVLAEGTASISLDVNVLGITDTLVLDDTSLATIGITTNVEVIGITDALTLAEGTATVNAATNILGITDALVLDDTALASINAGLNITGITDSLVLSENVATINAATNITGITAALTLAEDIALINAAKNILGITDALTLTEGTASVGLSTNILGITDALTLDDTSLAIITRNVNVTGITDALVLDDTALADISTISGIHVVGITAELALAEGIATVSLDRTIYGISRALTINEGKALIALFAPPLPATSNSLININLGNVPQIDDPQVYEAVLQVHSAIEAILEYLNNPS